MAKKEFEVALIFVSLLGNAVASAQSRPLVEELKETVNFAHQAMLEIPSITLAQIGCDIGLEEADVIGNILRQITQRIDAQLDKDGKSVSATNDKIPTLKIESLDTVSNLELDEALAGFLKYAENVQNGEKNPEVPKLRLSLISNSDNDKLNLKINESIQGYRFNDETSYSIFHVTSAVAIGAIIGVAISDRTDPAINPLSPRPLPDNRGIPRIPPRRIDINIVPEEILKKEMDSREIKIRSFKHNK